jgi:hypothetical protein
MFQTKFLRGHPTELFKSHSTETLPGKHGRMKFHDRIQCLLSSGAMGKQLLFQAGYDKKFI